MPWRLRLVLLGAGCAGLVLLLNAVSWRAFGGNSDDANAVLAGHALVHGNVLLHGWQLPTDSYWSVDLPLYGVASLITGVRQSLLHIVPSAIAAAVVVAAVVLAAAAALGYYLSAGHRVAGPPPPPIPTEVTDPPVRKAIEAPLVA